MRFWANVQRQPADGCWEWTGDRSKSGYGVLLVGGAGKRAHRIAWFLEHGEMPPDGIEVCHHCDNRACVRPSHLFLGDHAANMRDAKAKGRLVPPRVTVGENHPNARLTVEIVRDIRRRVAAGETHRAVADSLGIERSGVSMIVSGKRWGHVK